MKRIIFIIFTLMVFITNSVSYAKSNVKENKDKLADDPTKIVTKFGVSYANDYDMNDGNVSISGSLALDEVRKINIRLNKDASEWRIGGSWLFPIGIINFNLGKNEYTNGADQTNYSIGTFVPLSFFGFEPLGLQIFPTFGYTYNDGEVPRCNNAPSSKCSEVNFNGEFNAANGFNFINISGSSGYVGAFALRSLTESIAIMSLAAFTYGSSNSSNSSYSQNYKGFFGGLGMGYTYHKRHSFNVLTLVIDNNTYLEKPDKRFILAYTYQWSGSGK